MFQTYARRMPTSHGRCVSAHSNSSVLCLHDAQFDPFFQLALLQTNFCPFFAFPISSTLHSRSFSFLFFRNLLSLPRLLHCPVCPWQVLIGSCHYECSEMQQMRQMQQNAAGAENECINCTFRVHRILVCRSCHSPFASSLPRVVLPCPPLRSFFFRGRRGRAR